MQVLHDSVLSAFVLARREQRLGEVCHFRVLPLLLLQLFDTQALVDFISNVLLGDIAHEVAGEVLLFLTLEHHSYQLLLDEPGA
jgi:hypothetical protein